MTSVLVVLFWGLVAIELYTHVGYPLLMWIAGRRSRQSEAAGERPRVSLIIPAHNEEAVLREKLENSLALDYPRERIEIVVASDGSEDATIDIADEFRERGVRVLDFRERRGKASVVNDAVAAAEGEVLCLCDANVIFRPDALAILVDRLADPSVGAATGEVRLSSEESNFGEGESFYYRIERAVQEGESRTGSLMGVDGGMYVIRRELYEPLPPDTILDDFVTSMRTINAGKKVVYEPRAVAFETGTPHAIQEYRRRVRIAAGAVQSLRRGDYPSPRRPVLWWQFVSHKLLRWIGPFLLVALLVVSALLWQQGPVYRAAFVLQIAFYLVAAVATAWVGLRRWRWAAIPFYFVMSHVAIADGVTRGLFNRQKVTWARADRAGVPGALSERR